MTAIVAEFGKPGSKPGTRAARPAARAGRSAAEVRALAQAEAETAIRTLVELCESASDTVRRAAANDLLDRGYGRPRPAADAPDGEGDRPAAHVLRVELVAG